MKSIVFILTICVLYGHAKILECRPMTNMKMSVQLANNNFKELKSANGTIYKKVICSKEKNACSYRAFTDIAEEGFVIFLDPSYKDDVIFYSGIIINKYKNGQEYKDRMICYDLLLMNKQRIKKGIKPSPIIVQDY